MYESKSRKLPFMVTCPADEVARMVHSDTPDTVELSGKCSSIATPLPEFLAGQGLKTVPTATGRDCFSVRLDLEGAAFEGEGHRGEIARILRDLAEKLECGRPSSRHIMDVNGNVCGEVGYFETVKI